MDAVENVREHKKRELLRQLAELMVEEEIGDGLPWNWSIWREHFPTFTPILDFIHAVQYLYAAAQVWESNDEERWSRYLVLAKAILQLRAASLCEDDRLDDYLRHRPGHPFTRLSTAA